MQSREPNGIVQPSGDLSRSECTLSGLSRAPVSRGLMIWLAGLVCLLLAASPARADRSPTNCTGSALGISLATSIPDVHIGDTLYYSANVFNGTTNTGSIACDASSIQAWIVTPDGKTNNIALVRTTLTQGEFDSYPDVVSYVVRAQDVQPNGTLLASATDTGIIHQNVVNGVGGSSQEVNTEVNLPCVLLAAQCVGGVGQNGTITFTGTVTNCGNDTLINVTVTNYVNNGAFTVLFPTNLASGQIASYSGSWTPSNPCGLSPATLTVVASDELTSTPRWLTNSITINCENTLTPGIAVAKLCPAQPVSPGQLLTFSGSVSNTGNVTLTNIVVLNNQPAANTPVFTLDSLAPGVAADFTGSYTAPSNCSVADTLIATASSVCGVAVTNSVSATCPITTTPLLAVTQNCPANPASPGGLLTYSGTVSNAGNITLTNVVVLNNLSGATPVFTAATLAPGAVSNFTGSYLAPDTCSSTSTSTATGRSICGVAVTNAASATCPITARALLAVSQNCPATPPSPGDLLTYSGTVSNAGNITLTNVVVLNNLSGATPVLTAATLEPGATANFTGSYVAPDTCSSTSTSTATAQSICGVAVTNAASATCPITTTPLLAVTQVCPTNSTMSGGPLTYSGTVSNAGNITLTNVVVVNNLSGDTPVFTAATLAPGAVSNFTGSYLAPTNCFSMSTLTATGRSLCGVAVTNAASMTCPVTTRPLLAVTQHCPPSPVSPGALLTYRGTVSNAGNITLTNVVVLNNLSGATPVFTAATLAPGAAADFTGSYLAPDTCSSTSTSTATGESICGVAVTNSASATCPITARTLLAVTQNCPVTPVSPGGLLTYSGTVSNAGNITLTNVVVLNNRSGTTPVFTAATLAPGAVSNFTGSYLASTNCSTTSTLTATGRSLCGVAVTNAASATCPSTGTPAIEVTETCPTNSVLPGGILTYRGTVSNAGNITLTHIVVVDNRPASNTVVFTRATLEPGAKATFTGSYRVPADCCVVWNTLQARGRGCGGVMVTNTDTHTCTVHTSPKIVVTKTCPPDVVRPGHHLHYSGMVSNAGNITLINVIVVDNQPSNDSPVLGPITLAPGESVPYDASYLLTAEFCGASTVTASGSDLCTGLLVTDSVTTTCRITTTPRITVTKNCPLLPTPRGGLYTYTGTVSNSGNVTLIDVFVVNNKPTNQTPVIGPITLEPETSVNFTNSYTAPACCCSIFDTLTARGKDHCTGSNVTDTAAAVCPLLSTPEIAVLQDCPSEPIPMGSVYQFSGYVINTGDTTLTNVFVFGPQGTNTPVLGPIDLAPSELQLYSGSYTVPFNICSVSVTASGQDICGGNVASNTASCPVATTPLLAVTQNCPATPVSPGALLTYSGTVSNAGNITLTNVVVLNNLSGVTPVFTTATLAPGAAANFTGSYLAPADCSSTSTSTVTGQSLCGVVVTKAASATCPITTTPLLAVTQNCPTNPVSPGALLTYTGTVSNAGNITLTNVVVLNNLSGATPIYTAVTLAPGAVSNFTGGYLAPTNCSSTSTSTATGQSLCGVAVTNAASATCPSTFAPDIAITETCPPGPVTAGSTVVFGGSVSNSGNITLTNVLVFSSQPSNGTPVLGPITLAAGASAPFTGSYIALGGSNPVTNSTIVTNSTNVITTNTTSVIVTNNPGTVTTNSVTPTFGTIDPVSTVLTDRFNVISNLHGLMYADQDENWGATLFYCIREPAGGADEFDTISTIPPSVGVVTDRFALTASNYDALTLAAPDVGYGAVNFYYVRHDNSGVSTFGEIIAQGASSSTDLWPLTNSGYNALAFAAANLGYGANMFYYLRQDNSGLSTFGTINPTPGGIENDLYSVGTNFDALVFVPGAVSTWGTAIFAYLRHDSTGSIIGTINPVTQVVTDRIDLGTNFLNDLTFTATDVGYGANLFYYIRAGGSTLTTNTVTTYTTNSVVSFTPTNTVTASGTDTCLAGTVAAAADCLGPVALALPAPVFEARAAARGLLDEKAASQAPAAPVFGASAIGKGFFSLSFQSENGVSYTVQYKNTLYDPTWTDLKTVVGTGGKLSITDALAAQRGTRFYRVILTP